MEYLPIEKSLQSPDDLITTPAYHRHGVLGLGLSLLCRGGGLWSILHGVPASLLHHGTAAVY